MHARRVAVWVQIALVFVHWAVCRQALAQQPATQAECAKQRDEYKKQIIEFKKGVDLGRAVVRQKAKEAGTPINPSGENDQQFDPEKLAASKYQECIAASAKGAKPADGKAAAPAAATPPNAATGLRLATPAEIAECRGEAGKLGAVFTVDGGKFAERKSDAKDKAKFGARIFEACLSGKGATAPFDPPTAASAPAAPQAPLPEQGGASDRGAKRSAKSDDATRTASLPKPVIVREGPQTKCNAAATCSGSRSICVRYCRDNVKNTRCSTECLQAHALCVETGTWSTRNCEKTGMTRE